MFISHPLDTVKTNMQNDNLRFLQAAKHLFKTEGVRKQNDSILIQPLIFVVVVVLPSQTKSYYRGLLFPLCSTGFLNSIIFGVYGNSFRIFQNM